MPATTPPLLFIGGYAPAGQPGLQACRFDPATGALTAFASFSGILNPAFLVTHPNGRWLYCVSETSQAESGDHGAVWALRYGAAPGGGPFTIEPLNHQSSRGDAPCHLRLDGTGRWLIVTNYTSGSAAVYPIQTDGALGEMADFVQHHGHGPNAVRQEGPHTHSSIMTPDDRYAVIAELGLDQLLIYELDHTTGKLRLHGTAPAEPGAGPRHMAFHPDGQHLYVANELNSTIAVYTYDAAAGSLRPGQVLPTLPPTAPGAAVPENTVADIHLDSAARRVYVSNRGHNSLAAYDIDSGGQLTPAGFWPCGGNWPRNFALAPGGRTMLVANQYSNEVSVLPLDGPQGVIGSAMGSLAAPGPACIEFAPTL
jgi:6-phosphogluconolactonase